MLSALRRFGVSHALRASTPRAVASGLTPRALQWHPSSVASLQIPSKALYHVSAPRFEAQAQSMTVEESEELSKFSQLADKGLIDPRIIQTIIHKMKISDMTDVQKMTIEETLKGGDVLAQAKTGTGKTLAFLLPVLQNILVDPKLRLNQRRMATTSDIRAIIISPTRELAEQIATEARRITMGTGLQVQTAVGGTQKRMHLQLMRQHGCHLLVGTPGRLLDLLSDPNSGVRAPRLSSFVLDEADRLLDDGFSDAIQEIQDQLPTHQEVDRQTLLFSATVPSEVMSMVNKIMKPDYKYIRTVKADEVPTHLKVPQKVVPLNGFENALPAILELVKNYQAQDNERPFKGIVYFNSTKEVNLAYEVFRGLLNSPGNLRSGHPLKNVRKYELHSRLTQARRSLYAQKFRNDASAILFSSDVTARGMDFPDVTHVIQVGLARDRESYIHRLGRTGRADKSGEGWAFIHKREHNAFKEKLRNLPIERDDSLASAFVDRTDEMATVPPETQETFAQVKEAMENVPEELRVDAYKGQMGGLLGTFDSTKTMISCMKDLAVHGYHLSEIPSTPSYVLSSGNSARRPYKTFSGIPDRHRMNSRGRQNSGFNDRYNQRGRRDSGYGGSFRGQGARGNRRRENFDYDF
ncbi:ATP-dependent RNA helicase pitchoune [Aspergillus steynii IBT 23096]|uniref:ATP-dependent RNA helicase n=1 Tax=Aspergillus steynii IBT 23096 TaxID=1392250 RepID=A0A2I2G7Q0_9EURO|nr:ATP-dependent RNA helicase pitchoune [Aspergillus steynii IBT 23096]PLB48898.1 ATP-dependent RNA helicase pitchoune [Aspergillus steynii IBT 23096]